MLDGFLLVALLRSDVAERIVGDRRRKQLVACFKVRDRGLVVAELFVRKSALQVVLKESVTPANSNIVILNRHVVLLVGESVVTAQRI